MRTGVLTGRGAAPALNGVISAVVRNATLCSRQDSGNAVRREGCGAGRPEEVWP